MMSARFGRRAGAARLAAGLFLAPLAAAAQTAVAPAAAPAPAPLDKRAMARVEARINELHNKLRITPAQQPQWDAFTAVMRENAQHTDEAVAGRRDPLTMTALEEMRAYTAIASTHAADMQKMLPVFEALYTSMSPEQQKLADAVFHHQAGARRR